MLPSRPWREALWVLVVLAAGLSMRAAIGSRKFVFAGSDSYGYNKLADQLRTEGRYALGPPPEPLHWARPPGYPLYVALVKRDARAEMSGGEGWQRIKWANIWLEVLGTGLLLYFAVRRMAGLRAALAALALLMLLPFNAVVTPAALTETLATFFTAATGCLLVHLALDGEQRRARWFLLAGALGAYGVLVRPDALLLGPAFLPALWARAGWRKRGAAAALAALGFLIVFAPWPIRNQVRFGELHPLGGRIDRYSQPVEHYQGSWAWLRSFSHDWVPMARMTTCFYDQACEPNLIEYDAYGAFDSPAEREQVRALLVERRLHGQSQALSDGFGKLADARRRAHPLKTELVLPFQRWLTMWVARHDELVPPHAPAYRFTGAFRPLSVGVFLLSILGAILTCRDRKLRRAGLVLTLAVFGRTLVMAWAFYSMPRYLLECLPLAYALVAVGVSLSLAALARASSRRNAMSGVESASMKI